MWSLSLITAPAAEPLDIETEVFPHLRLEPELTPQETILAVQVQAARERCEAFTSRQLITATWELWLDSWWESCPWTDWGRRRIMLPLAPLQQQAGSPATAGVLFVTYVDAGNVVQTLATTQYQVDAPQGPRCGRGSIFPAFGVVWPGVRTQPGAVKIRFTAGYGTSPDRVPAALRQGMLLTVGELDSVREEQTVGTIVAANSLRAEQLWFPYRVW